MRYQDKRITGTLRFNVSISSVATHGPQCHVHPCPPSTLRPHWYFPWGSRGEPLPVRHRTYTETVIGRPWDPTSRRSTMVTPLTHFPSSLERCSTSVDVHRHVTRVVFANVNFLFIYCRHETRPGQRSFRELIPSLKVP